MLVFLKMEEVAISQRMKVVKSGRNKFFHTASKRNAALLGCLRQPIIFILHFPSVVIRRMPVV